MMNPNLKRLFAAATLCLTFFALPARADMVPRELRGLGLDQVTSVAFSPDEATLVDSRALGYERDFQSEYGENNPAIPKSAETGMVPNVIRVWDVETGALRHSFGNSGGTISSIAYSPDGRWLAAGFNNQAPNYGSDKHPIDSTVKFFDAKTWELVKSFEVVGAHIRSLDLSADGRHFAVGLGNDSVRIFDIKSGRMVRTFWGQGRWDPIRYSADGRLLALCGIYNGVESVRICNAKTGKILRLIKNQMKVCWAPDQKTFVTCDLLSITIWNTRTGKLQAKLEGQGFVSTLGVSPDNRFVIAHIQGGMTLVIDRETPKTILGPWDATHEAVPTFSKRGGWLAMAGNGGTYLVKM